MRALENRGMRLRTSSTRKMDCPRIMSVSFIYGELGERPKREEGAVDNYWTFLLNQLPCAFLLTRTLELIACEMHSKIAKR